MAIFRDGVKVGNKDFRVGLSKERGQGILRKIGVLPDDKGRKKFEQDARGEIQNIRTMMGMGEGFTRPINFKVRFGMPRGIDQQKLERTGDSGVSVGGAWKQVAKGSITIQANTIDSFF